MSKSYLIVAVIGALLLSACASSTGKNGVSARQPAYVDCKRVAPIGSRIKSEAVCGQQRGRRSAEIPGFPGIHGTPRDIGNIGGMSGNRPWERFR